jgi:hypothetical protein
MAKDCRSQKQTNVNAQKQTHQKSTRQQGGRKNNDGDEAPLTLKCDGPFPSGLRIAMSKAWRVLKNISAAALAHHKLGLRVANASEYETEPMVLYDKIHPWNYKVVKIKSKEFLEVEKLTFIMQQHKDIFAKREVLLAESLEELEDFIEAADISKEWPASNRGTIKTELLSWWTTQLSICEARLKEEMAKAETQAVRDKADIKKRLECKILLVEDIKTEKEELKKKTEAAAKELKKRGMATRTAEPDAATPPVQPQGLATEPRVEASLASAFSVASTSDMTDPLSAKEKQWEKKVDKLKKSQAEGKGRRAELMNKLADERVTNVEKQQKAEAELEGLRAEIAALKTKKK